MQPQLIVGGCGPTNGFSDQNKDQTGCTAQAVVFHSDGPGVNPLMHPNTLSCGPDQFVRDMQADTGTNWICIGAPGSRNVVKVGLIKDAPNPGQGKYKERFGPGPSGATDPVTLPYPGTPDVAKNIKTKWDAAPVKEPQYSPYVANRTADFQTFFGAPFEQRMGNWPRKSGIPTGDTPFGSLPSLSMLQGLPGMVMSLASSFGGLSNKQKKQIEANTSNQIYSLINVMMTNAVDVGTNETVSLTDRVHKETFANNMVTVLSQCKSRSDVIYAMHELRTNTALHGKNKLPTVEFKMKNAFGDIGLIIDGNGTYTQNISPAAANAESQFLSGITAGVDTAEAVCTFEGQITGNTLQVTHINYGRLFKGAQYYIEGFEVAQNTYITLFNNNAKENVGFYSVSQSSNTAPNTDMILHKITPHPLKESGGGGGGVGGLCGMFPGMNMFGEASKLIGESIPVLGPDAAPVVKMLGKLQAANYKSILSNLVSKAGSLSAIVRKGIG